MNGKIDEEILKEWKNVFPNKKYQHIIGWDGLFTSMRMGYSLVSVRIYPPTDQHEGLYFMRIDGYNIEHFRYAKNPKDLIAYLKEVKTIKRRLCYQSETTRFINAPF